MRVDGDVSTVVMCCSVLQCVAVCCSVLPCPFVYVCVCIRCQIVYVDGEVSPVVMFCGSSQCVAVSVCLCALQYRCVYVSVCACALDAKLCGWIAMSVPL